MSHPLSKRCLTAAMLAALPLTLGGCLAVNAMFGVLGLVATGPVQYAGTAYTVGEYAYHYAVNDMTPVEVFEEKFAWLGGPEAQPASRPVSQPPEQPVALAMAAATDGAGMATSTTPPAPAQAAASGPARAPEPVMVASRAPSPGRSQRPKEMGQDRESTPMVRVAAAHGPEAGTPHAPGVIPAEAHPARHTPLAERMDRLESALAQAERMYLRDQGQGVRCAASTADRPGDDAGVSGAGTVRHPVMRTWPGPADSVLTVARRDATGTTPAWL